MWNATLWNYSNNHKWMRDDVYAMKFTFPYELVYFHRETKVQSIHTYIDTLCGTTVCAVPVSSRLVWEKVCVALHLRICCGWITTVPNTSSYCLTHERYYTCKNRQHGSLSLKIVIHAGFMYPYLLYIILVIREQWSQSNACGNI